MMYNTLTTDELKHVFSTFQLFWVKYFFQNKFYACIVRKLHWVLFSKITLPKTFEDKLYSAKKLIGWFFYKTMKSFLKGFSRKKVFDNMRTYNWK